MAYFGDDDPGRVESTGPDDGALHRPRDKAVATDEGPDGGNLRMHECRRHDCRSIFHMQEQVHHPRQPLSDNELVGSGAQIRELL